VTVLSYNSSHFFLQY